MNTDTDNEYLITNAQVSRIHMQQIAWYYLSLLRFHNALLFICTSWIKQSVAIHIQFEDISARILREHLALIQTFMQKLEVRSKFSLCVQTTRGVELNLTARKRFAGNY